MDSTQNDRPDYSRATRYPKHEGIVFKPGKRHDLEFVTWTDMGHGWERGIAHVQKGESASNPCSTKPDSDFYGPATVEYQRAPDGGLVVTVRALESVG